MVHFSWQYPWTVEIGSVRILWHVILEYLAFFIGFRYYVWLRKRQGDIIKTETRLWVLIGAIAGAIIGSRLVGGLENLTLLKQSPNKLLYFYSNKTVAGGFLGGLFGVEAIKKIIGEKTKTGDLFVHPMLLALIIGRVGCVSMGMHEDVYGYPTSFFTGINVGDGLKRHPLMLYEISCLILLWIFIRQIEKNFRLAGGARFKIFMIAYIFFRLCIEFLKTRETYFLQLGAIQIACLLGLVYYGRYILFPKNLLHHENNIATPAAKAL